MKQARWPLVASLAVLVFVLCGYHLLQAKLGHQNYRDQHLGTALLYAKGNIDLLHPVIVGFSANDAPYPLELPVWQATAAVLFKTFGTWYGWANVASLLFFLTGLWPLYQLGRRYVGERGAWWTLLFFSAQPLVFDMAGRGGTDGSCEAFALWFLYFADALIRTGEYRFWFGAFAFGTLTAITKLPFFFCAGLAAFFLLLLHGRKSLKRWLQLGAIGLLAGLIFVMWHHYGETCYARAEFPFATTTGIREDGKQADSLYEWVFGTWSYRMDPRNWLHGAWRFAGAVFGSFALAGLALWALLYSRNRLAQLWIAAAMLTTLVFTHLVLHHHHYYLMFTPAVALLCAAAATRLEELAGIRQLRHQIVLAVVVTGVLLASTLQGLVWMNSILDSDPYPRRIAGVIRQYTGENDKLLLQGSGWGGEQFFLSGRNGLSIWDTRFLEEPKNLARIKELGYTRLVMISETPLLHAVRSTKPGQSGVARDSYQEHLTPVARDWPTILQTEDILIKEIPK